MFCSNCGGKLLPDARFCGKCGKPIGEPVSADPIESVPSFLPINAELRAQSDNSAAQSSVNPRRRWMIASVAALIALLSMFLWIGQNDSLSTPIPAGQKVSSAAESIASTEASSPQTSAPALSVSNKEESKIAAVEEEPASPAYIRINQVDSVDYDKGKVDVYFSLFSDENLENELSIDQLNKTMFKVDGRPVSDVSLVRASDSVSVNLVLDKSGSMQETASAYNPATKIELVRSAAINFIQNIPQDSRAQIELLSFSDYAPTEPDLPFTSNLAEAANQLTYFESDGGQTALYDSLTAALYNTNVQSGPKYIIVFTDGYDSGYDSGYGASSYSVVELSQQLGIPIYTIGFGDTETTLEDIAFQTGGQSFSISEGEDLQQELQQIYSDVFQRYSQQYKVTYTPSQQVNVGEEFPIALDMNAPGYEAYTDNQMFIRKLGEIEIDVQSALSEYQGNYARAVNESNFEWVRGNLKSNSAFYDSLKKRIEIDYANEPKQVDPIQSTKIESINLRPDQSYEIKYFKLFSFEEKGTWKYEANVNTYVMTREPQSSKWQVSEFQRNECSIYDNEYDLGTPCGKGEQSEYKGNPWTFH